MEKSVKYDFNDIYNILNNIRKDPDPALLREFAHELNMIFKESHCESVLYTNNVDKQFFGVCVYPYIEGKDIYDILINDNHSFDSTIGEHKSSNRIRKYDVELDSKLFNPVLRLTNKEILAIVLHDIGALVNSSSPVDIARNEVDVFLDKTNSVIIQTSSYNYASILVYGFKDLLWKITSVFFKDTDNLIADEFIIYCGLGMELEMGIKKLKRFGYLTYFNSDKPNATIIAWTLTLYDNVLKHRIPTIRGLRKAINYTAIRLIKREINHLIAVLGRIDDASLIEAGGLFDGLRKSVRNAKSNFKYSALRDYENDLYEYTLKSKSIVAEDDALMVLHGINTRMSIIDNILREDELDDALYKKYSLLYEKYAKLREDLAKRQTYRNDYRRIYINYPTEE